MEEKQTKKGAKGPKYRKINRFVKSKNQYWKERNRRRKSWELSIKYNYKQIAEKLGVSIKTVQRDIKKIRPYYYRLNQKYQRELEREQQIKLDAKLAGKTIRQQGKILTKLWNDLQKLMKSRKYLKHTVVLTIDLDDMTDGIPTIKQWPKGPSLSMVKPIHIKFVIKKDDKKKLVGTMTIAH